MQVQRRQSWRAIPISDSRSNDQGTFAIGRETSSMQLLSQRLLDTSDPGRKAFEKSVDEYPQTMCHVPVLRIHDMKWIRRRPPHATGPRSLRTVWSVRSLAALIQGWVALDIGFFSGKSVDTCVV